MSDYIITADKYRLAVCETNKAHELGFFKWKVAYKHPELPEYPETLISSGHRYMTLDVALREVFQAYFYPTNGVPPALYLKCWTCRDKASFRLMIVDFSLDMKFVETTFECRCKSQSTLQFPLKVVG